MHIIAMPRAAGKTSWLRDWIKQTPHRYIVCFCNDEARRVAALLPNQYSMRVVSVDYLKNSSFLSDMRNHNIEVAIDNVELVLIESFFGPILVGTITIPDPRN